MGNVGECYEKEGKDSGLENLSWLGKLEDILRDWKEVARGAKKIVRCYPAGTSNDRMGKIQRGGK